MRRRAGYELLCGIILALCGCREATTTSVDGRVVVAVVTTGADVDRNGYTLTVGSQAPRPLRSTDSLVATGGAGATLTVQLDDVAPNCAIAGGDARQSVQIPDSGTVRVRYDITCTAYFIAFGFHDPPDPSVTEPINVFTIKPDGTDLLPVVRVPYPASPIAWSPDRKRLAYAVRPAPQDVAHAELHIIGSDGTGDVQLPTPGNYLSVSWAPDGQRLAVVTRDADGFGQIMLMPAAGGASQIIDQPSLDVGITTWSPDGAWLAFTARCRAATMNCWDVNVYLSRIDGSERRQLTSFAYPDAVAAPTWSPDGRWLLFTHDSIATAFGSAVERLSVATGQRLTVASCDVCVVASWSPDGKRIAYIGLSTLSIVDVAGTGARTIYSLPPNGYMGDVTWTR